MAMIGLFGHGTAWSQSLPGSKRPVRIGILLSSSRMFLPAEHPVFGGLRDVGLVDGRNATVLVRDADGDARRMPQLARELVAAQPDIIISAGPPAVQALKLATTTIPIVFAIISDPVAYGIVASFARPGGNLTGLSMVNTELSGKRLELLKELSPKITRIAVVTDPALGPQGLPETKMTAQRLGLELQIIESSPTELEHAFAEARRGGAQAVLVMPTPFYNITSIRHYLAEQAVQSRLPSMCEEISYVRDGCLLSYGPDFIEMWRRSAVYVDKILKGANPADLPVEQPTKFNLFVNQKTAKSLGITIPVTMLARADEVFD